MVWLFGGRDPEHVVLFSEGSIERTPIYIAQHAPGMSRRSDVFDLPDRWVAGFLTARTKQYADQQGFADNDLELETWVLAPSTAGGGAFDQWFEGQSPDYRIIIHHQAAVADGCPIYRNLFETAYSPLRVRHRRGPFADLKHKTLPHLRQILDAYKNGHDAVWRRVKQCGHPFSFARLDVR